MLRNLDIFLPDLSGAMSCNREWVIMLQRVSARALLDWQTVCEGNASNGCHDRGYRHLQRSVLVCSDN